MGASVPTAGAAYYRVSRRDVFAFAAAAAVGSNSRTAGAAGVLVYAEPQGTITPYMRVKLRRLRHIKFSNGCSDKAFKNNVQGSDSDQLGFINGTRPGAAHSSFGSIPGFPYTAPYEEITHKT